MEHVDEVSLGGERLAQQYTAKVAVCIPAMDMCQTMFMYDLARMLSATATVRPDIKQYLFVSRGSLIPKLRETLVANALETDATHVLFLDSDMRFPKDLIIRLLDRNVEAVCANYHERSGVFRPVAFKTWADFEIRAWTRPDSTGLEPIAACGAGVMLIRTDVLRRLARPRFAVGWKKDTNGFIGEDIWFCNQMKESGVQLYLDHDVSHEVAHIASLEIRPADAIGFAQAHQINSDPQPEPPTPEELARQLFTANAGLNGNS